MYPGFHHNKGEGTPCSSDASSVYSNSNQNRFTSLYDSSSTVSCSAPGKVAYNDWQADNQGPGIHVMGHTSGKEQNESPAGYKNIGAPMHIPYGASVNPCFIPMATANLRDLYINGSDKSGKPEVNSDDPMLSGFVPRYKIEHSDSASRNPLMNSNSSLGSSHSFSQGSESNFSQNLSDTKPTIPARPAKPRLSASKPAGGQKQVSKEIKLFANFSESARSFFNELVNSNYIQEKFDALFWNMPSDPDSVIAMMKPHIELEPEFLTNLGGIYKELEDDSASIKASISNLQKRLNELRDEMGRNIPSKQAEPLKVIDAFLWELIIKEMEDFQDLVSYEHREKRRRFKALVMATQKQVARVESKKVERLMEETKQKMSVCKNIANGIGVFWKKIEKFAWERLKRELQSTLVEKKRMRLDKFVEDAIKISLSKNDKVRHGNKSRKINSKSEPDHSQYTEKGNNSFNNSGVKLENEKEGTTPKISPEPGTAPVKVERKPVIKGVSSSEMKSEFAHSKAPKDEDEFVISEEMMKMEQDDELLERAMEKEEEQEANPAEKKQEINALQDDLNVPIEEVLKRYQLEAERFKEEHSSAESAETEDSFEDDSSDDEEMQEDFAQEDETKLDHSPGAEKGSLKPSEAGSSYSSSDIKETCETKVTVGEAADDPDAEFMLDEKFNVQENEDMDLDNEMSDEHSDSETGKQERVKEISALEDEANIPIEELLARYKAEASEAESGATSESDAENSASSRDDEATSGMQETDAEEDTDMESEFSSDDDDVKVPSLIKATLRPYQVEGLRWLASLYRKKSNGILADEMGLGKTLQTISLLAHLACDHGNWGPHLIVVPTSVLINWEMEFKKFCPGFTVLSYYGSPTERAKKRTGWNKPHAFNVCIASYATVVQDAYILKRKSWVYMILDEAQNIKNFNSKRWQTLLTFNTEGRILLTGTPLQNSLQELWSLMHFILPEIFSSHSEFKEWFSDPLTESIEREQGAVGGVVKDARTSELVDKLHMVLRPYLLRRLKKDVEKQMPSKYEHVIKCYLSRRQRVLYDEFISSRSTVEALNNPSYRSMLFVLMQLRKICNHPDQLQSRPVESPYYDPNMMEDVEIPKMFVLPDWRSDARLYRHERVSTCRDLPEKLVMHSSTSENRERLPLSASFLGNFTSNQLSMSNFFLESTNLYDYNVSKLPIVGRQSMATCLLNVGQAREPKELMYNHLMREISYTMPHTPMKWFNRKAHDVLDEEYDDTPVCSYAREYGRYKSLSSLSESDSEVEERGMKQEYDPPEVLRSASSGSDDISLQDTVEEDMSPDLQMWDEDYKEDEACSMATIAPENVAAQPIKNKVIFNRRELLELDDTFFLKKFTIARRCETKMETFKTLVRPTVDDLVEQNWWMMSRFVCITGARIECNPRRIFTTGKGGIAWRHSQEALLTRVRSRSFKDSPVEYYRNAKYTIEHARGMQKLLFPPRSLLHEDCGKFLVLGRLMKKLKSEGHRCLLYTQFSKMLDILENWINYMGFTYVRLDGSTKVDMRQRIVTRFNENQKIFLFISSTRAGGVGLTLTGADTVIFYDTDWNPAMDRQAMDRCHRIGQTREVNVYRLVSEHTVEENIWRKQLQKRRLDDIVVDKGKFDSEHHDWFSNVDTLMTILKTQHGDAQGDEEDIYGRKVLHESEAPEPVKQAPAGSNRVINLLAEAEDEDDSTALLDRTKETETMDQEFQMDFSTDLVSTIPSLVAYCIQFMLKYKTPALQTQQEEMTIKIQAEEYDSAVEEDSGSSSHSQMDPNSEQEEDEEMASSGDEQV